MKGTEVPLTVVIAAPEEKLFLLLIPSPSASPISQATAKKWPNLLYSNVALLLICSINLSHLKSCCCDASPVARALINSSFYLQESGKD